MRTIKKALVKNLSGFASAEAIAMLINDYRRHCPLSDNPEWLALAAGNGLGVTDADCYPHDLNSLKSGSVWVLFGKTKEGADFVRLEDYADEDVSFLSAYIAAFPEWDRFFFAAATSYDWDFFKDEEKSFYQVTPIGSITWNGQSQVFWGRISPHSIGQKRYRIIKESQNRSK